jgi:hypothetical protein
MGLNSLVWGVVIGALSVIAIVACAGATFPYKGYPYDMAGHRLVGATSNDDLPDSVCMPTTLNQRPCMVILSDDYFTLKGDYIKNKDALDECQRGNPPSAQ